LIARNLISCPRGPEQHLEQLPHLSALDERMAQGKIGYDLVAVAPSLSERIRWAARSVIPTAVAMSRRRIPGSSATQLRTWAWLVRKSHDGWWFLEEEFMNT